MNDNELQNEEELLNAPPGKGTDLFSGKNTEAERKYIFPVDIPDELRGWILGLIPTPMIKSLVIRKTHKDFQTAGTTKDVILFKLPANSEIISSWFNVVTAFAGGAISAYTISVGPDGTETTLNTAQAAFTGSTGLKKAIGTDLTTNRGVYSLTTTTNIEARATSTTANTSASTAGEAVFYLLYYAYPHNG